MLPVLLALPQHHRPLSLPPSFCTICPSPVPAPWAGWKAARFNNPWVESREQISLSLPARSANHSLPALLTPQCRKGCITSGQEVYQSPSLSLHDKGAQTKLGAQGRLVAILFHAPLPACSKFWLGDLLPQSWYLYT